MIEQLNHQLDIIHDTSPEGMFTLAKQSKDSHGWFPGFPYAHPDPTLPAVMFNHQLALFDKRDVRWALALLIDIKAVAMASYRGAATISAIGVPPTGGYPESYFEPMESWLKDFKLDTGKRKIKPYDPTSASRSRRMLRPSMGEQIPTDPALIAEAFGRGWWKPESAGGRRTAGAGRLQQARRPMVHAGRQAVHGPRHRRGRSAPDDDPRRQHGRAAMAAVRHRRQHRRRAGHA